MFEIAAVQKYANLVELEKCCQTHIFLQNFVLMQPRTSPPKICKIANFANVANFVNVGPGAARRPARRGGAARGAEGGLQRRGRAVAVPGAGQFLANFRQNFARCKFRQSVARFRLYRHRFLQQNMRFAAFFKIFQIFKLKFLKFGNILQILRHLRNFC